MGSFLSLITAPFRALISPFRWLLGWLVRLVGVPGRLGGLSLQTRLAIAVAIACSLIVTLAYLLAYNSEDRAHWSSLIDPMSIGVIVLALLVMPGLTYQVVKIFLEGPPSAFPEIDEAWQAGLAELAKNGLDLNEIPVFLLLGANDGSEVDAILDATGMELIVRGVPQGKHPLRWYANERAAFLACPQMGCLSLANVGRVRQASTGEASGDVTSTLVAGDPQEYQEEAFDEPVSASPTIWGTLVAGVRNTITPGEAPAPAGVDHGTGSSRVDKQKQTARLEHVGNLLRRARQPYCPLNGALALVPWRVLEDASSAPMELSHSLRKDMHTMSRATLLSFPVTTLVTGLEQEAGFLELTRRVSPGERRARFGKGFSVANLPTRQNMEALASHAQGAFEDFVYKLFREPDGLAKLGNVKLYGLLCKVRSRLAFRLRNLLVHGFEIRKEGDRQMLGGVYFAATGNSADIQAFVKGVTDKVIQLEEEVEWVADAVEKNDRFLAWSQWIFFLDCLVAFGIVAMLIYFWMQK